MKRKRKRLLGTHYRRVCQICFRFWVVQSSNLNSETLPQFCFFFLVAMAMQQILMFQHDTGHYRNLTLWCPICPRFHSLKSSTTDTDSQSERHLLPTGSRSMFNLNSVIYTTYNMMYNSCVFSIAPHSGIQFAIHLIQQQSTQQITSKS